MPAAQVEEIVEQTFLDEAGDLRVSTRSWVPGEDHTEELARVRSAISRLENERDTAVSWDAEDEENYTARKYRLVERRNELKDKPQRPAGWAFVDTGVTYGEAWRNGDTQERRKLLLDAGVRFVIHSNNEWDVVIPDDIGTRLQSNTASN